MSPLPQALTPEALLGGPRGRRLCLEVASRLAADSPLVDAARAFGHARFYAANGLGRGDSTVYFSPTAKVEPHRPTAAEVAALLDAVPLSGPTADALLHSLVDTVAAARYWQEPDGDDHLAAAPEMRRSLHRFAVAMLESPHAAWWSAPMAADGQWAVAFIEEPPRPMPELRPAAAALEQGRLDVILDEVTAARDRPADPSANWSGSWWSRPGGVSGSTRMLHERGPVGLWLVEDGFGERRATTERLELPAELRIHEIDSPAAWAQLCRDHAMDVTASKRHDWYRTTGRAGPWLMPDWARLQDMYDGVHLTMGGYLSTAGVAIPLDGGFATVLAGWEPDTTYWLRDVPPVAGTRQQWAQEGNSQFWQHASPVVGS